MKMLELKRKSRLIIIALLLVTFLGTFSGHKLRVPKRQYSDFHCFYVTGKRILNQENIYVLRDKTAAEFRYAPIFAVLMSALALFDEDTADTIWYIVNFCLLILAIILMEKMIIPQALDYNKRMFLYTLLIAGIIRFVMHNFDSGQANILMLSSIIIGLYYISKGNFVSGGAILSFSIMIKYTPLIFIPYFLLRRRFKLTLVMIGSVIVYLILPALFVGLKNNFSYIKELFPYLTQSTIFDQMTILDPKNQSLLSLFHRFFTNCVYYFYAPPMPFQGLGLKEFYINLIFIVFSIFIYSLALYSPKKNFQDKNIYKQIDYALLLICAVLFNLNAWMPTFILLALPYFIIAAYLVRRSFKHKLVFGFLLASYILNIVAIKSFFGKTIAYKLHFYSPLTLSALIIFIVLLKLKFTRNLEIGSRL